MRQAGIEAAQTLKKFDQNIGFTSFKSTHFVCYRACEDGPPFLPTFREKQFFLDPKTLVFMFREKAAPSGNRTRIAALARLNSTTKPLAHLYRDGLRRRESRDLLMLLFVGIEVLSARFARPVLLPPRASVFSFWQTFPVRDKAPLSALFSSITRSA